VTAIKQPLRFDFCHESEMVGRGDVAGPYTVACMLNQSAGWCLGRFRALYASMHAQSICRLVLGKVQGALCGHTGVVKHATRSRRDDQHDILYRPTAIACCATAKV
jgi:hypothetical protein